MTPRVSIILPAYNHETYVGAAIQSALAQTLDDFELIIINDGSTDGTGMVIEQFADPRIRYFCQENQGLSAALNRGLSLARGEYFGFLPSDDVYEPEKLARQVAYLDAHPGIGLVFSHQTLIDAAGAPLRDQHVEAWFGVPYETKEEIFPALFERNFLAAPTVLMRMVCFDRVGGFDESLTCAQDYDLWLRALRYYDIRLGKERLIRYRWHGGNLTFRGTERTESERAKVLLKACRDLQIEDVFPSLRTRGLSERALSKAEAYEKLAAYVERSRLPGLLPVAKIYHAEAERWRVRQGDSLPLTVVAQEAGNRPSRGNPGKLTILMEVRSLDTGGMEEVVFDLARLLDKERFNVVIVCVERGGHVARKCRDHGIPVEVLGEQKQQHYSELLDRHCVDLVCAHYSTLGAPLAAERGIPLISVVHNLYVWLPTHIFSEITMNDAYVSRYVAVSEGVERYLTGRFHIPAEKVSVIQNGLDVEGLAAREREALKYSRRDFGLAEEDYVFLHVAAITGTKGHNALIRAMKDVILEYPQIKVLCVGDTLSEAYADIIKARVKEWGLEGHVLFTGFVDRITDLYRLADAFVLPSLIDGWSLAVGEAMFFRLPLILTRVGSAETIIEDGDIGRIIEPSYGDLFKLKPDDIWQYCVEEDPANVRQLVEAMIDFYGRRTFWKGSGERRRAKILTDHTLALTTRRYEELFIREVLRVKQDREGGHWHDPEFAGSLERLNRRSRETGTLVGVLRRRLDQVAALERQNAQQVAALDARGQAHFTALTEQLAAFDARLSEYLAALDARGQNWFSGFSQQIADLHALQQAWFTGFAEQLGALNARVTEQLGAVNARVTEQVAALDARQQAQFDELSRILADRLKLSRQLQIGIANGIQGTEDFLFAVARNMKWRGGLKHSGKATGFIDRFCSLQPGWFVGGCKRIEARLLMGLPAPISRFFHWLYRRVFTFVFPRAQSRAAASGGKLRSEGETNEQRVTAPEDGQCFLEDVKEGPHNSSYDVICFPITAWDFRFQRTGQLLRQFVRHGHRVFYIDISVGRHDQQILISRLEPGIHQVRLSASRELKIYGQTIDDQALGDLVEACKALRDRVRIGEAVSLVGFPFWAKLADRLRTVYGFKIAYDCMDDHRGFGNIAEEVLQQEDELAKSADLLVVSSEGLQRIFAVKGHLPLLIRNATDFDHFNSLPPNDLLRGLSKPIIGYYGAIAEWFDSDLIEHAAIHRPEWNFVLIGRTVGARIRGLRGLPNVHFLGEQPYESLPQYLYHFDVCCIPFQLNDLTRSTNPVKFYEYLSSGKPIVSVDLPELRPYREHLYVAHSPDDFLAKLECAVAENERGLAEKRIAFARENSWEERFERLARSIAGLYKRASIVLLSYNTLEHTRRCVESLFEYTDYPNYEIIIVDNGSTDGSKDFLAQIARSRLNIELISNDTNRGFAAGTNQGIAVAEGEYLVFLNNDTVVTKGWLTGLVRHLQHPEIGMVGPVTNSIGNEARIEVPYGSDLSAMHHFAWKYTTEHWGQHFDIPVLAMFCVAMRREVVEAVGLLDENFEIGFFEDDDFALRVKAAGLRVVCARDIFVHHLGGASFSLFSEEQFRWVFERNKAYFERKWKRSWKPHAYSQQSEMR